MNDERDETRLANFPYYSVNKNGSVFSYHTGTARELRPSTNKSGHQYVCLYIEGVRTSRTVHSLVAETFLGIRPERYEVRHLNGNSRDNRLANLTYGTHRENSLDTITHGRSPKGERNGMAKITQKDIGRIKDMIKDHTQSEIARAFGIHQSMVSLIINGRRWA